TTEKVEHPKIKHPRSTLLKNADPDLLPALDPSLNPGIDVNKVTVSARGLYWRCLKHKPTDTTCTGHVFKADVRDRIRGIGCSFSGCHHAPRHFCPCAKEHTLASLPEIVKRIDPEFYKENKIDPGQIGKASMKYFWWRCLDHKTCDEHRWFASVSSTVKKGGRCAWCALIRVCRCHTEGFLDAHLLVEFNKERNRDEKGNPIDPKTLRILHEPKYWWRCAAGHEWQSSTHNRMKTASDRQAKGRGCHVCHESGFQSTLRSEIIKRGWKFESESFIPGHKLRFDFLISDLDGKTLDYPFAIEADGELHFVDKFGDILKKYNQRDSVKNKLCENKYHLLRIGWSFRARISSVLDEFVAIVTANPKAVHRAFYGKEYNDKEYQKNVMSEADRACVKVKLSNDAKH